MTSLRHQSICARWVRILALAASVLPLMAGAATPPKPTTAVPAPAASPVSTAPAAPAMAVPDQYRIGSGDTLHITVYQSPDLSLDVRVNETGDISYPLLGRVRLGGLSVNAAEQHLAQALKKGEIVRDPQVIIAVTTVRASQVNVLGQVGRPGRYPLDLANMRLTEVLALAGGIVAGVGSDTIVLTGLRDGKPYRYEVDLPRIFTAGAGTGDVVVMPGDTIWIDRAPTIYLYGEIQHPGVQRLERGMTVMQAVAAAGGATARGTLKGLKVTRRGADGRLQAIEPSMEDTLKDGDVVFIRESLF